MCRLPLSEVHASMAPEGLKRSEKMVAESVPRRRSAIRAQLLVAYILMMVPYVVTL